MRRLYGSRLTVSLVGSLVTSAIIVGCGGSVPDGGTVEVTQKGIDSKQSKIDEIRQQQAAAHKKAAPKGR